MIPDHSVIYENVTRPEWFSFPILLGLGFAAFLCALGTVLGVMRVRWLIIPMAPVVLVVCTAAFYVVLTYQWAKADAHEIATMLRRPDLTLRQEPDGRYSLYTVVVKQAGDHRMEFPTLFYISPQHWERLKQLVRENPQYKPLPEPGPNLSTKQNP